MTEERIAMRHAFLLEVRQLERSLAEHEREAGALREATVAAFDRYWALRQDLAASEARLRHVRRALERARDDLARMGGADDG